MAWLAGVDGCKGGWIVAIASDEGSEAPLIRVVSRFADLFAGEIVPDLVAVDMPIGLPDRVQGSGPVSYTHLDVYKRQMRERDMSQLHSGECGFHRRRCPSKKVVCSLKLFHSK